MNSTYQYSEQRLKNKRQQFHVQMHHLGIMHSKSSLLASYDASSTLELSEEDLDELIYRLKKMDLARYEPTPLMREWRSNVLSVINKLGIYVNNNDWKNVNTFMLDKRIAGKLMYELTVPELKVLHRKLMSIARKQDQKPKIEYSLN